MTLTRREEIMSTADLLEKHIQSPGKQSVHIESITPMVAAQILEHSGTVKNRKPNSSVVAKYARDMHEGKWKITHQGIALDENGILLDGQHRLMAIVESGTTQNMYVTRGVARSAFACVDAGEPRSLSFRSDVPKDTIAILRMMYANGKVISVNFSSAEVQLLYRAHSKAIEFVESQHMSRIEKIGVAPVLAAIATAYYHVSPLFLTKFCDVLKSGMSAYPGDKSIVLFRDHLMKAKSYRDMRERTDLYLRTMHVLHVYSEGRIITVIRNVSSAHYDCPNPIFRKRGENK